MRSNRAPSLLLLFLILLGAGLASGSTRVNRDAKVSILSIAPSIQEPIPPDSKLTIRVAYSIERFRKSAFRLSPQFTVSESQTNSGGTTAGKLPFLETKSGESVFECDLSKLAGKPEILRPLQLRIFLLEEKSNNSSSPVAISDTVTVKLQ